MSTKDMEPSLHQFESSSLEKGGANELGDIDKLDKLVETGELDVAVEALKGQSLAYTQEENDRVLRKIDMRLLPLMAFATGLQFVDKLGLGSAATYGLRTTLHLVGQDYSWTVSSFYFGYFAGSFGATRLLQRFHAGKVVAIAYICWSCTLLGMLGARNFSDAMALRFLLGLFESASTPGILLITTMWYTQKEQPFRFSVWNVLNGWLPIPFILIYYGLGHSHTSLVPWRLIFLVLGLVSFTMGLIIWFFLPDNPTTASWLTPHEKAIAVERVAASQTGIKNSHIKWYQVREALFDYRVWTVVLLMLTSQAIGSVTTNFLGVVITGFGYSPLKAQLLQIPNSAVQGCVQLLIGFPPTRFRAFRNAKQLLMATVMSVALAGTIILYVVKPEPSNKHLRLGACILLAFSGGNLAMTMSVLGTNIGGYTKKSFTTSLTFFAYCIINIVTPQTFLGSESPRYHTGLGFVMALTATFIVICLTSTVLMNRENARRDKLAETDPAYTAGEENHDIMSGLRDQTDRENFHHRYSA